MRMLPPTFSMDERRADIMVISALCRAIRFMKKKSASTQTMRWSLALNGACWHPGPNSMKTAQRQRRITRFRI